MRWLPILPDTATVSQTHTISHTVHTLAATGSGGRNYCTKTTDTSGGSAQWSVFAFHS
ncbi:MAG: hypothetical protein LBG60_05715 [Bifidobacteriaceae bacterium]|jgi:hypothetical protein|nr:hypothetical protein [Bifidobacteriaceae bacterium]